MGMHKQTFSHFSLVSSIHRRSFRRGGKKRIGLVFTSWLSAPPSHLRTEMWSYVYSLKQALHPPLFFPHPAKFFFEIFFPLLKKKLRMGGEKKNKTKERKERKKHLFPHTLRLPSFFYSYQEKINFLVLCL
eukprot:TRINITY_DN4304_c4_g1_i1.p1 TRINITY_DN4304_c4_g1~~TRINITY_DN4304_c4_g1_i1.p1  ORF type:complete len:131 (+),score=12.10 TRINITY_DN4304_c4_g1_i1:145-537(+)